MGETISIAREEGVVEEIRLSDTVLSHADRSRIVIPNRKIVGEILHNFGMVRQINVQVGVAYDTEIERALQLVRELLAQNARVLKEPAPVISVLALSDSAVQIGIRPWTAVADYADLSSEVTQAVLATFRANRIEIPLRPQEVRLLDRTSTG